MQIPQTHLKPMPEMSPDRYVHTRGVYCCNVMWHGFQIVESSERAKDKAPIYAFLKYVVRHPYANVQPHQRLYPQRGCPVAKLLIFPEVSNFIFKQPLRFDS